MREGQKERGVYIEKSGERKRKVQRVKERERARERGERVKGIERGWQKER